MPSGNCVLFIAGIGAFYSRLYNLKEHPNYSELYEPRDNNSQKLYNHKKELEYGINAEYKLLCDSGLSFATPIEKLKIEDVNEAELKNLVKSGVVGLNDLKINYEV